MGTRYLIDSNAIIDFCNGKLPTKGKELMMGIEPEISIVSNIEIFSTKNINEEEYSLLQKFVAMSMVHPVNSALDPS